MNEYDLVVIGAGSGLDIASGAAGQGWSVAIIEDGPLGGTCLNRGCIPSKMLIHHAEVANTIRAAERFHIDADINDIDFAAITSSVAEEIDADAASIERGVSKNENIDHYAGEGRFTDELTLEVNGETVRGEKVVVAAGTRPFVPPIDGLEDTDYWTSKAALRATEQPGHLVIIGGGYIATELAHFYGSLGTEITIIEMGDRLIGREDRDISDRFTKAFSDRYTVHLGYKATHVAQDGSFTVTAENKSGDSITVEGDAVLVAAGRVPNSDRLNVEAAGIETDDRGFIETDETLQTTAENTWALGDIVGNYLFKHAANHEASHVFHDIMTEPDHTHDIDYTAMPHAIFSDPQVAGVGKTEQELEDAGTAYVTGTYEYERTGMGAALKETGSFVKVLADPEDGTILGCHIIGSDASQLIHEVLVAMKAGSGTVFDIRSTIHIHPALNEVVQRAFNNI